MIPLRFEEIRTIEQAVRNIHIDRCPPSFDLRSFIVGMLKDRAPDLAEKVKSLSEEQLVEVCRGILERQRLDRWMLQ